MKYLLPFCLALLVLSPAWSAEPKTTQICSLPLQPVEVFALQPQTRRMALRGVLGAGVNQNRLAGKNLASVVKRAPMSDRPPLTAADFDRADRRRSHLGVRPAGADRNAEHLRPRCSATL